MCLCRFRALTLPTFSFTVQAVSVQLEAKAQMGRQFFSLATTLLAFAKKMSRAGNINTHTHEQVWICVSNQSQDKGTTKKLSEVKGT